jgi:hypothetical protein
MRRTKMGTDRETNTDDLNIKLAEAIRLLAERVAPRPLDKTALEAIKNHDELKSSLQFVFQETPASPTGKY